MKPHRLLSYLLLSLLSVGTLSAKIIADFEADYDAHAPKPGWAYLWNPAGVEIGQSAGYVPLIPHHPKPNKDVPGKLVVEVDGMPAKIGIPNAAHLAMKLGFIASGNGPEASTDGLTHYAIVAYTIQEGEAGVCTIADSLIERKNKGGSNDFRIYVNGDLLGNDLLHSNDVSRFDVSLGDLKVGDTVYIALGGVGKKSGGANLSFKIKTK